MAAQFKITGLKEIERALKQLEGKIAKKVLRQAMRAALKPVQAAAVEEAPIESGDLEHSIKVRSGKRKKGRLSLQVSTGREVDPDVYYAPFVQFGHRIGSRKLGSARSIYPGDDFLKRAYDRTKQQAKATAERLILEGVERIVNER